MMEFFFSLLSSSFRRLACDNLVINAMLRHIYDGLNKLDLFIHLIHSLQGTARLVHPSNSIGRDIQINNSTVPSDPWCLL